jgi:hypothetical protein
LKHLFREPPELPAGEELSKLEEYTLRLLRRKKGAQREVQREKLTIVSATFWLVNSAAVSTSDPAAHESRQLFNVALMQSKFRQLQMLLIKISQ